MVKDFNYQLIQPDDITTYTNLTISAVVQSLIIPFSESLQTLKKILSEMFETIEEVVEAGKPALKVLHRKREYFKNKSNIRYCSKFNFFFALQS